MAIDLEARCIVADAIEQFLSAAIDNWVLDDTIFRVKTEDEMCLEIRRQLWLLYDDVRRYRNGADDAFSKETEAIVRRWQALLRSDMEWSKIIVPSPRRWWSDIWIRFVIPRLTPKPKFTSNPHWPFNDLNRWKALCSKSSITGD